jgi:hypothetical protein
MQTANAKRPAKYESEDIMSDFSLLWQQVTAQLKSDQEINAIFDTPIKTPQEINPDDLEWEMLNFNKNE